MTSLKEWMRREGVSDEVMAAAIGGISAETVRKLRFRSKGASIRVAARIDRVTNGEVRSPDLVPTPRLTAPSPKEVRP